MDFLPVEYDQLGVVRSRQGNLNAYSAPSDVYKTQDDKWLVLAVSAPTVFKRLTQAIGRPDLLVDPAFNTNAARIKNRDAIETIMKDWFGERTSDEASRILHDHDVSFSPIYDIDDIVRDPHFVDRQMIIPVEDEDFGSIRMQNVVPRFSKTPGVVWRTGPAIGQHNEQIYGGHLGLTTEKQDALRRCQII